MAKGTRRRIGSRRCRATPYPLPSTHSSMDMHAEDFPKITAKEDWEDANCSVCMEYPHNAVLLLCSCHDKGCRPYMCGTGFRYSNCLDQYKKAHTKCELMELPCPLCRGQVKGWTVVEPAREYLNTKKRSCMQDNCSFSGTYKDLRKHVKADHPCARPREVDPLLEQKWRRLEHDREREDVISTIRSSMPGAVVFGDYVIDRNHGGFVSDEEDRFNAHATDGIERLESNFMNVFLLLQRFGSPDGSAGTIRQPRLHGRDRNGTQNGSTTGLTDASASDEFHDSEIDSDTDDDDGGGDGIQGNAAVNPLLLGNRVFLGRGRRRRRRTRYP